MAETSAASFISKLKKALEDGNKKKRLRYIEALSDIFNEVIKENSFYELPIKTISHVLMSANTNDLSVNKICKFVTKLTEFKPNDAVIILNNLRKRHATLDETLKIISCFTSSPICRHLGRLVEEENSLLSIDYTAIVKEKNKEIEILKEKLYPKPQPAPAPAPVLTNEDEENIHVACQKGYIKAVENLLANGTDVNLKDSDGKTPLHYAARSGQLDIGELLVSKGAKIESKDNNGETPLLTSTRNGHYKFVEFLVSKDAFIDQENDAGWRPLHIASQNNDILIVQFLVEHGAIVDCCDDNLDRTPIIMTRSFEVAKYLIEHGADVNHKDSEGNLVLLNSVNYGSSNGLNLFDYIKYFIGHGADVNVENKEGDTILLKVRDFEIIKYLVKHGADVNHKDNEGETILSYVDSFEATKFLVENGTDSKNIGNKCRVWENAIKTKDIEAVKYIYEHGFNINIIYGEYGNRKNSLIDAAGNDSFEIFQFIADRVDNITSQAYCSSRYITPLFRSIEYGKLEYIKYLIKLGETLDKQQEKIGTPLTYAASLGKIDIVEYCIDNGIDVNQKYDDKTALVHSLAYPDVTKLLISKGADVNAVDSNDNTVMHFASSQGYTDSLKILIDAGANKNAKNKEGKTPHDVAKNKKCRNIILSN